MAKPKQGGSGPDLASLGGVALAVGGIVAGLILEGGKIQDISQFTAGLIVMGGTVGAVMLTSPMGTVIGAAKKIGSVFFEKKPSFEATLDEIVEYAAQARRQGIVSLEQQAGTIADPFLRKALNLAVDGVEMSQIRAIMELEIELQEQDGDAEAKVFEAAGGYAPTVGIIGAVLGLIQVMKNLANIDEVGRGIAVAFVATVYGVASANLFFLPAASKIKARMAAETQRKELILEGVSGIVEGLNPKLIRSKLEAYGQQAAPAPVKKEKKAAKTAEAPAPAEAA